MADFLEIPVREDLVVRMKKLGLTMNLEASLEKLLAVYESQQAAEPPTVALWSGPYGSDQPLPVGERLYGEYRRQRAEATIVARGILYAGKTYQSLSQAARAVKKQSGKIGSGAATNGRDFWKIRDAKGNLLTIKEYCAGLQK